ncbi:MAG TPA: VIT1/CCC1 transporter family protein [Thermoanaerobaculia bacterium]
MESLVIPEHEHTPQAIRARLEAGPRLSYLRDWVYGGIDGSVTTFAVVAGVVGAHLSPEVILILGVANLLGDGFSMAASNYSGTRTERQEIDALHQQEKRHIAANPEGEREEVRQILAAKGFAGHELERAVSVVAADEERWIRFMLTEEYGLPARIRSALGAAMSTFSAFLLCGLVPLLPFVLRLPNPFVLSLVTTLGVFFAIGSARSRWLLVSWWRAGLETLGIGSVAAALAFAAGVVIARVTL